jgi:hypothetical protein
MEQLIDVVIGDIHNAPDACQCLRIPTTTQPVRRLNIRDLLPSCQRQTDVHSALVDGWFDPAAARLATEFPHVAVGLGYSAGGTLLWKAVRMGMQVKALLLLRRQGFVMRIRKKCTYRRSLCQESTIHLPQGTTGRSEAMLGTSSYAGAITDSIPQGADAWRQASMFRIFCGQLGMCMEEPPRDIVNAFPSAAMNLEFAQSW